MFNLMNKRLNKKGFTLIELIVVIAIIAILAVILLPRFVGFTEDANKKAAISDTRNVLVAVQAMQAMGDSTEVGGFKVSDGITIAEVNKYLGYTAANSGLKGDFVAGNLISDATDGTFQYASENGYTVDVKDYVIGAATKTVVSSNP